ncbi:peptidase inhibitor family I36 protein [Streptomyces cinnamoneus]|uniref:Peptidase inhibitor family I36 protein n=1 Tax=Streptomyces cinnamoneus TaxID=53446 RepID=A0A918WF58_STRCJ|nr:peptidase inhibitor family I36 protein [Streptomyces cinnamoneus]GHC40090.1 hypothetical protein GCM10010507_12680 [Streptomyces cinnamoneus]
MRDQAAFGSSAFGKALVALLMAFLGLMAAPSAWAATGPAGGSAGADFSAQARSLGLSNAQASDLQDRVDAYLAKTHGTQVAANKIALDRGGVLLLTLPGEERARDLDAKGDALTTALAPCPYTYVCAYSGQNFTGDELRLFTCNYPVRIYWNGTGSWINNQRSTLYARFYDSSYRVGWTSPGGYSEDRAAPWGWVWWLSPC